MDLAKTKGKAATPRPGRCLRPRQVLPLDRAATGRRPPPRPPPPVVPAEEPVALGEEPVVLAEGLALGEPLRAERRHRWSEAIRIEKGAR